MPPRKRRRTSTPRSKAFSVVHPRTPAAKSFAKNHLGPFVKCSAAGLLKQYEIVTSHGGLVLLERREINGRRRSERRSDLCVYHPMTGDRAFFPFPPDIRRDALNGAVHTYVVVTAADGIGCHFMLLAADMTSLLDCSTTVGVQTASSDASGQWGPVKYVDHHGGQLFCLVDTYNSAVVLRGVVHWLMHCDDDVLTYDVVTGTARTIGVPYGLRPPKSRYSL
ncbi:hypothetical protein BAE44_0006664 [Dichanthelium oligosanthes]|uniref:DUF1618 domain-containing protein n=1 Tax=Dichanthelium oligosanthes TaxID=888268 RepID=A0A1E5W4N9_9POAL|nr:hypothetical protein BAE44_0006664 [Dichanthelium oligosanthes]